MKFIHILFTFVLIQTLAITTTASAKDYRIVEEKNYGQELIGQSIRFEEAMIYLNLRKSPEGFLTQNAGIVRMLATVEQSTDNDIHIKEPVKPSMHFKLVKINRTIFTDLASWDKVAREMYLSFSKSNPDIDMKFVLEDQNGVLSTVGSGNYRKGVPIN